MPVDHDGHQPVADVKLTYRDLRERRDATESGTLAIDVKSDGTHAETADLGNAQLTAAHAPVGNVTPSRARGFNKDFDEQVAALEKAQNAADTAVKAKKRDAAPSKAAPKSLREIGSSNLFR